MEATAVEALAQAMGLHRAALVRTWRDTACATAKRLGAMPRAAAVVVVVVVCQVERAMRTAQSSSILKGMCVCWT